MRATVLRILMASALATSLGQPLLADVVQTGRWHLSYAAPPPFRMSILFRRSSAGDETRLLFSSAEGRLELVSVQGPSGSDTSETILDPESGEMFGRKLFLSRLLRPAACSAVRGNDGCVVFSGSGGERTFSLSAFVPGPSGAPPRAAVRTLLTPSLAAKVRRAAAFFRRSVEFDRYGDDFLSLIWPDLIPRRGSSVEEGDRGPGCAFDATFGHPCSDAERTRDRRRFGSAP